MEWLAVRLGSTKIEPRHFTEPVPATPHPQTQGTGSPLFSSKSKSNVSLSASQPGPLIFVNSKPVQDANATEMLQLFTSSPGYTEEETSNYMNHKPKHPVNSFSSYSISQAMRDSTMKRNLSSISKSDIRKLSAGSPSKTSCLSLDDSPNTVRLKKRNRRNKSSASLIIDSPCYFRRLSTLSLSDTPPGGRKLSSYSLVEAEVQKSNSPKRKILNRCNHPITKRQESDQSLSEYENFEPMGIDYANFRQDKDMDDSPESPESITSPSEHLQPHLRSLGLRKSPGLSMSGRKYTVNPPNSSPHHGHHGLAYDDNLAYLLPERFKNLCLAAENLSGTGVSDSMRQQSSSDEYKINNNDHVNRSISSDSPSFQSKLQKASNLCKKRSIFSREKLSKSSLDSDASTPDSPDYIGYPNMRHTNSPIRRVHCREQNKSPIKSPANTVQSSRLPACSRAYTAYSAIKCLFFRPTKRDLKIETNSLSSEEDIQECNRQNLY